MAQRLVARFLDGRILKGTSLDVAANRSSFHLRPQGGGAPEEVDLADLKALFFVKSFEGDAGYDEALALAPGDSRARGSKVVEARFGDGETIVGLTIRHPPITPFYFLTPVDPRSNNMRVLVNGAAVRELKEVGVG
jgi:hypothetical protein